MSQGRHQMRLPQPAPQGFQNQSVLRYTLSASGLSLESSKVAVAQRLSLIRSPDAPSLCEKSGLAIRDDLGRDPLLAPLVAERPGLRIPGAWDGFEIAIRAILGQQVTVVAAVNLAAKLVAEHGEPLRSVSGDGLTHIFPTPARIAQAHSPGMPVARA